MSSSLLFGPKICLGFATILAILASFSVSYVHGKTKIEAPMITEKLGTNKTIIVDINGNGEFKSIQEAINAVPVGNAQWVIIHVRKGIYR